MMSSCGLMFGKTFIPERTTVRHPQPLSAGDDAYLKLSGKILTFSADTFDFVGLLDDRFARVANGVLAGFIRG